MREKLVYTVEVSTKDQIQGRWMRAKFLTNELSHLGLCQKVALVREAIPFAALFIRLS